MEAFQRQAGKDLTCVNENPYAYNNLCLAMY